MKTKGRVISRSKSFDGLAEKLWRAAPEYAELIGTAEFVKAKVRGLIKWGCTWRTSDLMRGVPKLSRQKLVKDFAISIIR
jgi:hypothetical protein